MVRMCLAVLAVLAALAVPAAHGHGLGVDTVTADVGRMDLEITAELPSSFRGDSKRLTVTIQDGSGEMVRDVVMWLRVVHSGEQVLEDTFVVPDGRLSIDITTTAAGDLGVLAERSSGMVLAGPEGVDISGPIFGSGGLYTLEMRIDSVGGEAVPDAGVYLADLLVADTAGHVAADAEDGIVQFTTISYFDKVSSFEYDPKEGVIAFEMPFDWRESRVSHIPVVHMEVHFPRSLEEFVSRGYVGTINGVGLPRSSVTIDDFSAEGERTIHYVLLQDDLRLIKSQMDRPGDSLPDRMAFTLEKTQEIRSQLSAFTRSGDFQVDMTWEPEEILPGQNTKFIFTIRDANTGETLRNSNYDFVLVQDGREIYRTSGVAVVGGDFAQYEFTEDQAGTAAIRIENIRGTGQYTEFVFAVAPEFGIVAVLVLVVSVAGAVLISRRTQLRY